MQSETGWLVHTHAVEWMKKREWMEINMQQLHLGEVWCQGASAFGIHFSIPEHPGSVSAEKESESAGTQKYQNGVQKSLSGSD